MNPKFNWGMLIARNKRHSQATPVKIDLPIDPRRFKDCPYPGNCGAHSSNYYEGGMCAYCEATP